MQKEKQANKEAVLTLNREFNAPRELVFDAHADAKSLAEWWGPVGYKLTVISLDFRQKDYSIIKWKAKNG